MRRVEKISGRRALLLFFLPPPSSPSATFLAAVGRKRRAERRAARGEHLFSLLLFFLSFYPLEAAVREKRRIEAARSTGRRLAFPSSSSTSPFDLVGKWIVGERSASSAGFPLFPPLDPPCAVGPIEERKRRLGEVPLSSPSPQPSPVQIARATISSLFPLPSLLLPRARKSGGKGGRRGSSPFSLSSFSPLPFRHEMTKKREGRSRAAFFFFFFTPISASQR